MSNGYSMPHRSKNVNGHTLTRYNSSPALSAHLQQPSTSTVTSQHQQQPPQPPPPRNASPPGDGNVTTNSSGNFVTPRGSYDSLGSMRMGHPSSNGSGYGGGGGGPTTQNPWGSTYGGAFIPRDFDFGAGNSGASISRHNSIFSNESVDPLAAVGSGGNNGYRSGGVNDEEFTLPKSDMQEMRRLSTLLSSAGVGSSTSSPKRSLANRQSHPNLGQLMMDNQSFHPQQDVAPPGSSVSNLQLVDPAIEKAFQSMSQKNEQKQQEIQQLKTELEAILATVTVSSSKQDNKAAIEKALGRNVDGIDMAHRMTTKLKALKQENEHLGKMLSQGRAAQKEVELGVLRRENHMLKQRVSDLEAQVAQTQGSQNVPTTNDVAATRSGGSSGSTPAPAQT